MKEIRIGDTVEQAIERGDFPTDRVKQILKDETVAVLGYGVQGRGQSLNMRDNGIKVIVGQRKGGRAYDLCLEDGWKPGVTLFDPEEAAAKGTVVQYLPVRRRAEGYVAQDQTPSHRGQSAVLFARLRDRVQRPDRRRSATGRGRDSRRAKRIGDDRPPTLPRR